MELIIPSRTWQNFITVLVFCHIVSINVTGQPDGCSGDPCLHGTCLSFDDGSYVCDCPVEYLGINCTELKDPCEANVCESGSTCVKRGDGEYECMCLIPFTGDHCEEEDLCLVDLDECVDNLSSGPKCHPCLVNETCQKRGPDEYFCDGVPAVPLKPRALLQIHDDGYPFENWFLVGVIVGFVMFYILFLCCALFLDHLSKIHPRLILMCDLRRLKEDTFYLLTVKTGKDLWAGTKYRIYCSIFGNLGRTKVLVLNNYLLNSLHSNDTVDYLISTPSPLGNIVSIQLWLDPDDKWNSSCSACPPWYCRTVMIRDIKSEQIWYFFVRKWFSFKGRSALEVQAATQDEVKTFYSIKLTFREYMRQLREHHVWIHTYMAPRQSFYTRAERITTAAALSFVYLFFVILFYGIPEDYYHFKTKSFHRQVVFDSYYPVFSIGTKASLVGVFFGYIFTISFRFIKRQKIPSLMVWDPNIIEIDKRNVRLQTEPVQFTSLETSNLNDTLPFRIPSTDLLESEDWLDHVTVEPEPLLGNITAHKPYQDRYIHHYHNGRDNSRISKRRRSRQYQKRMRSRATAPKLSRLTEALADSVSEPVVVFRKSRHSGIVHLKTKLLLTPFMTSSPTKWVSRVSEPVVLNQQFELASALPERNGDAQKLIPPGAVESAITTVMTSKRSPLNLELCNVEYTLERHHVLPHWFVWVAWGFSLSIIVASATLVIFFGFRFSYAKSINCFASFGWAMLESFFFFQPIKVFITYLIVLYKRRVRHQRNPSEFYIKHRFKLIWFSEKVLPFKTWPLYYMIHPLSYNDTHQLDPALYPFPSLVKEPKPLLYSLQPRPAESILFTDTPVRSKQLPVPKVEDTRPPKPSSVPEGGFEILPTSDLTVSVPPVFAKRPSKLEWVKGVKQRVSALIQSPYLPHKLSRLSQKPRNDSDLP